MKIFWYLAVITLSFTACKEGKKEKATNEANAEDSLAIRQDPHSLPPVTSITDGLAKMAPLSREEMLAVLPPTLRGYRQQRAEANDAVGVVTSMAEYPVDDSTVLELTIIDCAGPAGVGIYSVQYAGMLGYNEEDDKEYTRTIDFEGSKAFEYCSKTEPDCTLTWFAGRFLVSLSGEMDAARLRQFASAIRL